jgi:tRNA (adenine37-N6)-methyltransferase
LTLTSEALILFPDLDFHDYGNRAGRDRVGILCEAEPEVNTGPEIGGPMKQEWAVRPVAYVHSPYQETGQVPKGACAEHHAEGTIEVLQEYAAGLQDVDGFSHLYIVWLFHQSEGYELCGVPACDDRPHGVFASRSPRRPNPLALTVVELLRREENRLYVRGLDMLDGTPVLDIKPYLSNIPSERLRRGWVEEAEKKKMEGTKG